MRAFCFYPMSKRRGEEHNWYALPYEEREQLMRQHGASGREFKGRILQVVTGSTGLDDWEWGVTLFGVHVDDLKECVYTMRFDEASTLYGEFGAFYTGLVGTGRRGARRHARLAVVGSVEIVRARLGEDAAAAGRRPWRASRAPGIGFTESQYERERFEEVLKIAGDIKAAADEGLDGVLDADGHVDRVDEGGRQRRRRVRDAEGRRGRRGHQRRAANCS